MTDLATLGIRVESQEADVAEKRLDDLSASAAKAEKSVDALATAARRADGATATMNTAVKEQKRVLTASQNAMGLTANEGLNLSRQMADVGVTLASGMNPFLVALQQGPQFLEVFQVAAIRTSVSVRTAMMTAVAGMYASMAPLLPLIGGLALGAGTLAAAWGLSTRTITKDIGDVGKEMGLTEDQLERLKEKNISTTATAGDVWRGLGTTIGDMLKKTFGDEVAWADKQWNAFLDDLAKNTGKEVDAIAGFFTGAFYVVRDTWKLLPAALGDAAVTSANAAISAINWLIQKSTDAIQVLRDKYNALPPWMRGGERAPDVSAPQIALLNNQYAGGMSAVADQAGASYGRGFQSRQGMSGRFMETVRQNTRDSRERIIRENMGDAGDDSSARARKAADDLKDLLKVGEGLGRVDLQPLRVQFIELVEPLKLIADELRLIDGLAQETAQGLASAFGESGRALGDLLTSMTRYQSRMAEINLAEKEVQIDAMQAERERAYAQIANYGDMLGAAKGFFQQGSDGYRALQAAEAAYRVFQFAMTVQAMAQNAAETSASVAGSAAKGTASAAAGAAKMFEALGPFGFPVVAAMIALLASLGLRGKGGGGGGSASVDGSVAKSQGYSQQADATQSSFAASVAQKVDVRVSADRDGIKAYIEGTAAEVAAPMVAQGMAAASGATRAQVMSDLDKGRTYSRGG